MGAVLCQFAGSRCLATSTPSQTPSPQVNSAATFPITAVQFGVNRLLERLHQDKLGRDPAGLTPIGIAMAAGATSALIGCPAELLMIQQQKSGLSLGDQFKTVARAFGAQKIYKGVVRGGEGLRGMEFAREGRAGTHC